MSNEGIEGVAAVFMVVALGLLWWGRRRGAPEEPECVSSGVYVKNLVAEGNVSIVANARGVTVVAGGEGGSFTAIVDGESIQATLAAGESRFFPRK